jgi:hypothetical protein
LPPANGIYRLTVQGTVSGQMHVHSLHFRSTVAAASLLLTEPEYQQQLIDSWQSTARSLYRNLFHVGANPCEIYRVRKVCGSLPLPAGIDEAEVAPNIAGSVASLGTPGAPWLASTMTWRTAFSGRSYRGRSYFGGLGSDLYATSTIGTLRVDAMAAYGNALLAAYVTPGDVSTPYRLFIYSPTLANGKPDEVPPVAPVACQAAGGDVTTFQTRNVLATMKSRKAGSGL